MDEVVARERETPSPATFAPLEPVYSTKQYKISKKVKQTMTAEILEAKYKTPGPGHYQTERRDKVRGGCYKSNLKKGAFV